MIDTKGLQNELSQLSTEELINTMNRLDNVTFEEDDILRVWHKKYCPDNCVYFILFVGTMWKYICLELSKRL